MNRQPDSESSLSYGMSYQVAPPPQVTGMIQQASQINQQIGQSLTNQVKDKLAKAQATNSLIGDAIRSSVGAKIATADVINQSVANAMMAQAHGKIASARELLQQAGVPLQPDRAGFSIHGDAVSPEQSIHSPAPGELGYSGQVTPSTIGTIPPGSIISPSGEGVGIASGCTPGVDPGCNPSVNPPAGPEVTPPSGIPIPHPPTLPPIPDITKPPPECIKLCDPIEVHISSTQTQLAGDAITNITNNTSSIINYLTNLVSNISNVTNTSEVINNIKTTLQNIKDSHDTITNIKNDIINPPPPPGEQAKAIKTQPDLRELWNLKLNPDGNDENQLASQYYGGAMADVLAANSATDADDKVLQSIGDLGQIIQSDPDPRNVELSIHAGP